MVCVLSPCDMIFFSRNRKIQTYEKKKIRAWRFSFKDFAWPQLDRLRFYEIESKIFFILLKISKARGKSRIQNLLEQKKITFLSKMNLENMRFIDLSRTWYITALTQIGPFGKFASKSCDTHTVVELGTLHLHTGRKILKTTAQNHNKLWS